MEDYLHLLTISKGSFLIAVFLLKSSKRSQHTGNCASSPSKKNPSTHAPWLQLTVVPVFLVCALSVGSNTLALSNADCWEIFYMFPY